MRHSLLLPTAVLAGALRIGCSDQSGAPMPIPAASAPMTALYPMRLRSNDSKISYNFQAQADPPLVALVGVGLEEFPDFCAGAAPQELSDFLIITHPSKQGGTSAHVQIKNNELSALVWQVDVGTGAGSPVRGPSRSARSTSRSTTTRVTSSRPPPGANAFFYRFVGKVTDQETGQRYHLQGRFQVLVSPDGTFKFLPVPFLSLRPIGG